MNICKLSAGALTALLSATVAAAATVNMSDGGMYTLNSFDEYNFTDSTSLPNGADDKLTFGFDGTNVSSSTAFSIFLDAIGKDVSLFSATWSTAANSGGSILASITQNTVGLPFALLELSTDFTVEKTQWFNVSWLEGPGGANALISGQVNAAVTPVPIPAAGLLLLGALGALAVAKRRQTA